MSEKRSKILVQAQKYVEDVLSNQLSQEIRYHSISHTYDVVSAAVEIARHSDLSNEECEIVELAGWFHDLGYCEVVENHERVSANMALDFLSEKKYDDLKAAQVAGCIMATQIPQSPKNKLEEVLCDADMMHLAKEDYFRKAALLHDEIQGLKGMTISEAEWLESSKNFINGHRFFTEYAREMYAEKKQMNLNELNSKLKKMKKKDPEVDELEAEVSRLKAKVKKVKEIKPTRGIETMFRLTSKNHIDLSSMADTKANIMISVNSIILSVLVTVLFRKLEEYPHLIVPAIIMTIVCLATIVFAILATRPNVSKGTFTEEDIQNKRTNLLFFGNFHRMKMDEYEWGMKEMMKDADYLYTSLIRDVYFLGVVLGKKYKLLRISYTIFMFGFVLAVISFMIAEMFFKAPSPY